MPTPTPTPKPKATKSPEAVEEDAGYEAGCEDGYDAAWMEDYSPDWYFENRHPDKKYGSSYYYGYVQGFDWGYEEGMYDFGDDGEDW